MSSITPITPITPQSIFYTLMSVRNVDDILVTAAQVFTRVNFQTSPYQQLYTNFLLPSIQENIARGTFADWYRLDVTGAHSDVLLVPIPDQPAKRLIRVKIPVEDNTILVCDGVNAIIQLVRHALGSGDVEITRASLITSYHWCQILYGCDSLPAALSAVSVRHSGAEEISSMVIERLAGASTPGSWLGDNGVFKKAAQRAYQDDLYALLSDADATRLRNLEKTARLTGRIGSVVCANASSPAELGNCAERPFNQWFMALCHKVAAARARSGTILTLVTMGCTRGLSSCLSQIRANIANQTVSALWSRFLDIMKGEPALKCRFPPCFRCRLTITVAWEHVPNGVVLTIEYDDRKGRWVILDPISPEDLRAAGGGVQSASTTAAPPVTTQGRPQISHAGPSTTTQGAAQIWETTPSTSTLSTQGSGNIFP